MNTKLVSVCMITHDSSDFIKEALLSTWDFCDQILVVDNCSIDGTLDILNDLSSPKLTVISKKFEGENYQEIVKAKRNLCLNLVNSRWLLVQDPDEIYMAKDLEWLHKTIRTTNKVHIRYKSLNFWKDFDHIIVGPHWDDSQERCLKNLLGLRYTQFAFSISVGNEVLAKKYGKDFLDGIYWATENQIKIFHYGMASTPWKIQRKIRNYMLSDNPAVTPANVEDFVNRHPYFSGRFDQPRHGPKGLWVAGSDSEQTREKVLDFKGSHPEAMQAKVSQFHKTGKMPWEVN